MIDPLAPFPGGWPSTRIDRVASVNARIGWKALTADEYVPFGYAFLATPNIKGRRIDFDNVNFISEFRYNESPDLKLQKGDVLLAKDGNTLGIVNVVAELPRPTTVNGSIAVLRPRGIDSSFFYWVLQSSVVQARIDAIKGGMGVPHLFQADIKKLTVPCPALSVQRAIADYLDAETARIDALIEKKRRMAKVLEDRFRSRQVEILTGGKGADRRPEALLGSIPATWQARRAKFCSGGITVGVVVNPSSYFVDDGVPFIHGTDVQEGFIDTTKLKYISTTSNHDLRKSMLRVGDVVAMRVGYPGRSAVVTKDLNGANCASVLIFRRSQSLKPEIVSEFLNSPLGRVQIESVQYGAAQGVMNVSDAVNLVMPVPPESEQGEVVGSLVRARTQWQRTVDTIERQVALLVEHRQALITAAVTGELPIPGVAA